MIIYFAGASGGIQKMPHATERYEHVLFSFFVYQKKDWKWIKKRKRKQAKQQAKAKKAKASK